jgi:glutamine synthetase
MLIEMHTMAEMIDTMVLPGGYAYFGVLADASAKAKTAGIRVVPQVAAANDVGKLIAVLRKSATALRSAVGKAESLHHDAEKQARFLTSSGADAMATVRSASDALELAIGDEYWPLPRYREMLFPV